MATKRLARTIIEGGRSYRNGWERRHSNGVVRTAVHAFTRVLARDPEHGQEHGAPRRTKVHASPHDKLGAARRWLRAQHGRFWDDVYAEIRASFDTRTIKGHHIVFDHLLAEVDFGWPVRRWRHAVLVDEQGRVWRDDRCRHHSVHMRLGDLTPRALRQWVGDRRIGRRGASWYWFERLCDGREERRARPAFRQRAVLSAAEARRWEAWSDEERRALTMPFDVDGRLPAPPVGAAASGRSARPGRRA